VLTENGRRVLAEYRAFETEVAEAGAERLAALGELLRDIPEDR
jgi:molybdenum-dependent DNA-binding transcriptional regulator ModE